MRMEMADVNVNSSNPLRHIHYATLVCSQGALRLASLQHVLLSAGLLPNNPGHWCVSEKPKKYDSQDNCMYRHVFWAWMKQISSVCIWRVSFFSYFMRVVFEKHFIVDSKPTVQAMSNLSEASSQTQPTAATHVEQSHAIPHRSKKMFTKFTGRGQCHPSASLFAHSPM